MRSNIVCGNNWGNFECLNHQMKPKYTIPLCLLLVLLGACKKSPTYFLGKWEILNVVEHDTTIDLVDNWIMLNKDGTFESYDGNLKKKEVGKWMYDPKSKRLVIDGAGETNDSEWTLARKQDTLFFHATSGNMYLIGKRAAIE